MAVSNVLRRVTFLPAVISEC